MFCQNCGSQLPAGAKFCGNCGAAAKTRNTQRSLAGLSGHSQRSLAGESGYDRQPAEPVRPEVKKEAPQQKKKYTILIGAIVAVLVLALIIFALLMTLGNGEKPEQPEETSRIEEQEEAATEATKPTEPAPTQPAAPAPTQPTEPVVIAPTVPETTAPEVTYEYRYEIIQSDMSWSEAKAACEARGGYLATITTIEEYDKICKLADETDLIYLWLGACLPTADTSWSQAGWITGESWTFENWYPGEPSKWDDDGALEYCLSMWTVKNGPWTFNDQRNDIVAALPSITGKVGYVCEYKIEVTK